jgi:hypothetical protein
VNGDDKKAGIASRAFRGCPLIDFRNAETRIFIDSSEV